MMNIPNFRMDERMSFFEKVKNNLIVMLSLKKGQVRNFCLLDGLFGNEIELLNQN